MLSIQHNIPAINSMLLTHAYSIELKGFFNILSSQLLNIGYKLLFLQLVWPA